MKILSYHFGHDGSITYLRKGRIIFHSKLERTNKFKSHAIPSRELIEALKRHEVKPDVFVITWVDYNDWVPNIISLLKRNNIISEKTKILKVGRKEHHIFHALCAFHTTKFREGNIYVYDAHGAVVNHDQLEAEECVSGYAIKDEVYQLLKKFYVNDNNIAECGVAYGRLNSSLGLHHTQCGHTMAFASHGEEDNNIPTFLNKKYIFNKKHFTGHDGFKPIDNLKQKLTLDKNDSYSKNIAWRVQKDFEEKTLFDIKNFISEHPCENLVITGGCAQNIFSNSRLSKELGVNVKIDPMCNDQGISIGSAIKCWLEHMHTKVNRMEDVFLGFTPEYNLEIFKDYKVEDTDENRVVELLTNKEIVAIYSGRSEQGQRGLGNRSLLADATMEGARDKVSSIKKRAWYRPFACSILKENFEEWFETDKIKESPFMLYTFKMKQPIKSVVGPNNMSRPHTVDSEVSPHYYKLINAFKQKTGIPLLLNTSLNLSGEALVETLEDLKMTMDNSQLKYAYLPDIKKLITKQF